MSEKLPEKSNLYERDDLLRSLRSTVMKVTFTKVDGEQRVMRCTLIPLLIEQQGGGFNLEADKRFHRSRQEILAVWDIDNRGWRSFHIDKVYYVEGLDPVLFIS